ncbi:MAG: MotA/TolQ/ExbB proton channel family protein [Proteobacteria bacterium]|nr:MotA/TolQ/ExbB proton channel family protein [Pseudomonadota bacterium]
MLKDTLKKLGVPFFWLSSKKNVIGVVICCLIFMAGFLVNGNLAMYFNFSALLIVFGGTLGATLICFRFKRLAIVWKVLVSSYRTSVKSPDEVVGILVDLSVKSKIQGLLSLQNDEEETTVMFLRQALGFLVDGYPLREIRESLSAEMYFFRQRREESERVLTTMADICPSFGLVGSVVGLISMLSGIGDTAVILATVPVALISTLYGIVLSNFFFLPFAANIRERTDQELLLQKIIMEGTIAIGSKSHPSVLERKLKSFLTPSAREGKLVSLKRIREILAKSNLVTEQDLKVRIETGSNGQAPEAGLGPS